MSLVKTTLKVSGLDCASCAMIIDDVLEELPGVKSAKTSFAKEQVEVEYDETKTSLKNLQSTIETAGYTVAN
ncbi:MAG: heavy metal-associated domain-containing protein [bacterium]|nr:heavy metal-associated domain-containing protein [bacterium]